MHKKNITSAHDTTEKYIGTIAHSSRGGPTRGGAAARPNASAAPPNPHPQLGCMGIDRDWRGSGLLGIESPPDPFDSPPRMDRSNLNVSYKKEGGSGRRALLLRFAPAHGSIKPKCQLQKGRRRALLFLTWRRRDRAAAWSATAAADQDRRGYIRCLATFYVTPPIVCPCGPS
jgi:hypothetical protein